MTWAAISGYKMGGNRNARRRSDCSRSLPARYPADPHEIGHDVIAGLHLQGGVERARPVKVFADLDRRLQIRGQSRVTLEVIVIAGLHLQGGVERARSVEILADPFSCNQN